MTLGCVVIDDDRLSLRLVKELVQKTSSLTLLKEFENPIEAVNYLNNNSVDLLFLDVEMPQMSGLELLQALQSPPPVILVTSKKDYALDAFEFDVVDYLLKPLQYHRWLKAVNRAIDRIGPKEEQLQIKGDSVFVKSDSVLVKIQLADIQWIEAQADYIAIVTPQKKYIAHTTMKTMEKRLPEEDFMRVHRSYIIRLDKIQLIEDNTIVMGKKFIPVGGTYRISLMDRLDLI